MAKPKRNTSDDPLIALRPSAAAEIVKAARASLKEPQRPVTPADLGRSLFATDAYTNRPASSHGMLSSRMFDETTGSGCKLRSQAGACSTSDVWSADSEGTFITASAAADGCDAPPGRRATSSSGGHRSTLTRSSSHSSSRGSSAGGSREPGIRTVAAAATPAAAEPRLGSDGRGTAGSSPPLVASVLSLGKQEHGSRAAHQGAHVAPHGINSSSGSGCTLPPKPGARGSSAGGRSNGSSGGCSGSMARPARPSSSGATGSSACPEHAAGVASTAGRSEQQLWQTELESTLQRLASALKSGSSAGGGGSGGAGSSSGSGGGGPDVAAVIALCEQVQQLTKRAASNPVSRHWLQLRSVRYCGHSDDENVQLQTVLSQHMHRVMDCQHPEALLKACAVLLRLHVACEGGGAATQLLPVARVLYRLSKDATNDGLFKCEGLLELLLGAASVLCQQLHEQVTVARRRSSSSSDDGSATAGEVGTTATPPALPGAAGASSSATGTAASSPSALLQESLIYVAGALKNLSNDPGNQKRLLKLGAVLTMSELLLELAESAGGRAPRRSSASETLLGSSHGSSAARPAVPESAVQAAVQVTGVLRNLATSASAVRAYLEAPVLRALRRCCVSMLTQQEVITNAARILSKLSLHEGCHAEIEGDAMYPRLLMDLLQTYRFHQPILVRIAFVLGNMTTHSASFRRQLAALPGALEAVAGLLELYSMGDEAGSSCGGGTGTAESTASLPRCESKLAKLATKEEVVVKLLRLVANLAIDPEAGAQLAGRQAVADSLVALLNSYSFGAQEELLLNCACALTNLSYYAGRANKILSLGPELVLAPQRQLLLSDNNEAVVEAARLYGNFARVSDEARQYMAESRILETLCILLDHGDGEVLFSVCGTLLNFTAPPDDCMLLVRMGCVVQLVSVLERCVQQELQPAAVQLMEPVEPGSSSQLAWTIDVVCKALCNVCAAQGQQLQQQSNETTCTFSSSRIDDQTPAFLGHRDIAEQLREVLDMYAHHLYQAEESDGPASLTDVLAQLQSQISDHLTTS